VTWWPRLSAPPTSSSPRRSRASTTTTFMAALYPGPGSLANVGPHARLGPFGRVPFARPRMSFARGWPIGQDLGQLNKVTRSRTAWPSVNLRAVSGGAVDDPAFRPPHGWLWVG